MNRIRRKRLMLAIDLITQAKDVIEEVLNEEEESLDSMPENLEGSENYVKMENAVDLMESTSDNLCDAIEWILEASQ